MKGKPKSYAKHYERPGNLPGWIANFGVGPDRNERVFVYAGSMDELEPKLSVLGFRIGGSKQATRHRPSSFVRAVEYSLEKTE